MEENQELIPSSSSEDIIVESKDGKEEQVSFQLMQSIYNEITGKTEEISRVYSQPFQMTIDDFEQLNLKVNQLYEQYNIASSNCNVLVYYKEDTKERFSSFERFRAYDQSRLEPIQSITFEYNFLIVLPKAKKAQSYKVKIQLESRASVYQERRVKLPPGLWRIVGHRTCNISIEYVDYVVARTFLDTIDRWIKGAPAQETSKVLRFSLDNADKIQHFLKYTFLALSLYLLLSISSHYLLNSQTPFNTSVRFLILGFATVFVSYRIGLFIGKIIENSASSFIELSYIKLNRGDDIIIEKAKNENKKSFFKAIIGTFLVITYGVISSIIATYLSSP